MDHCFLLDWQSHSRANCFAAIFLGRHFSVEKFRLPKVPWKRFFSLVGEGGWNSGNFSGGYCVGYNYSRNWTTDGGYVTILAKLDFEAQKIGMAVNLHFFKKQSVWMIFRDPEGFFHR
jgi:hypothetical protein